MFDLVGSGRYAGVERATHTAADGTVVVHLRRRFLPPAASPEGRRTYAVVQGDRLDNVTASLLDDPLQFWRVCDANGAMRPRELEVPGTRLIVPAFDIGGGVQIG